MEVDEKEGVPASEVLEELIYELLEIVRLEKEAENKNYKEEEYGSF